MRLNVQVRAGDGSYHPVDAVLDTGFCGDLALPPIIIHQLGLVPPRIMTVVLADGSQVDVQVYQAWIAWDGTDRLSEVMDVGPEALAGLELLRGYHLAADVVNGGTASITPLVFP